MWVSLRMRGLQAFDVNDLLIIAKALDVGVHELLPPPEIAAQAAGPRAIAHYFGVTERGSDHPDRPADNRPPGRPLAGAGAGIGRTTYLGRGRRGRRD